VTFDLYAWKSPRNLDAEQAQALLANWQEAGGDPGASPFEPAADIGWFYRELIADVPGLETVSDAVPTQSRVPIWMSGTDEPPARVVGMRLSPATPDAIGSILSLAAKYDLVLFDTRTRRLHGPALAAQGRGVAARRLILGNPTGCAQRQDAASIMSGTQTV
jgi:hypothetical protein